MICNLKIYLFVYIHLVCIPIILKGCIKRKNIPSYKFLKYQISIPCLFSFFAVLNKMCQVILIYKIINKSPYYVKLLNKDAF